MKRFHLFEFGDQLWFPKTVRQLNTDYLQFLWKVYRVYEPVVPYLTKVMRHMNTKEVLDLCSGSSGPWTQILPIFAEQHYPVSVTLTDKYPNIPAFEKISAQTSGQINYIADEIDATTINTELKGVRTIFAGYHHLPPEKARLILQNTVKNQAAICIFESTQRRWQNLVLNTFVSPLTVLFLTPLIKPFNWIRFFWAYMTPVVVLSYVWDGFVSNLRTYSEQDLKEIVNSVVSDGYHWDIGKIYPPHMKSLPITYLIGYPEQPNVA
ncbi:hypothetical protein [Mastigocoleus sp. MO_188.B34]|uniref:hypothetical protein n=1 Tax=Mastigocoleus sp. MO_188.B34 TaxID=3036635 RepID=UPI00260A7835|nr:hypothetical protein [Mastigocoleus sp. MO_188.B34]MDJ0695413.1 hypothetical protein [Mastigocoleus sp. MO_188.B34]